MFQKQYFNALGETGFETIDIFIKEYNETIYLTIRLKRTLHLVFVTDVSTKQE